jgi:hypothetical protein
MFETLSAEELARRLDLAGKVLCRAASNFRKGSIRAKDLDMISVGFQRHIGSFIDAVDHANDQAEAGAAAAQKG